MDELAQALNAAHDATAMTALLKLNPHLQTLPSPLLAQLGAAGQLQWLRQRPHAAAGVKSCLLPESHKTWHFSTVD